MKTIFTLVSACFISFLSLATSEDTTRLNFGGTQIIIIDDDEGGDSTKAEIYINGDEDGDREYNPDKYNRWGGLFIGVNGFMTSEGTKDFTTDLPASADFLDLDYSRSINVNLNFPTHRFNLGTPHVGLSTGFGFEFNRYDLKGNNRLTFDSDSVWGMNDSVLTFDKNFLKATYIQVPLILDFVTSKNPKKGLYVGVGIIGAYKIGSKMKVKYNNEGSKNKDRTSGHFFVNPFKVSATARIGWRKMTLFANYSLTDLFESGHGPDEIYPFSVGLSVIPF